MFQLIFAINSFLILFGSLQAYTLNDKPELYDSRQVASGSVDQFDLMSIADYDREREDLLRLKKLLILLNQEKQHEQHELNYLNSEPHLDQAIIPASNKLALADSSAVDGGRLKRGRQCLWKICSWTLEKAKKKFSSVEPAY